MCIWVPVVSVITRLSPYDGWWNEVWGNQMLGKIKRKMQGGCLAAICFLGQSCYHRGQVGLSMIGFIHWSWMGWPQLDLHCRPGLCVSPMCVGWVGGWTCGICNPEETLGHLGQVTLIQSADSVMPIQWVLISGEVVLINTGIVRVVFSV